jgi:NhaP-type Na+/H+ or K+/H+ antiporter
MALPVVVAMLAIIGERSVGFAELLQELGLGIALGIALPWGAAWIEKRRFFSIADPYAPLFVFAVGLLLLSVSTLLHANSFLAAFAGGITMASVHPNLRDQFRGFGGNVAELFKLAALLVFGALISPVFLAQTELTSYVFAVLMLVAVRPLTLSLALMGSRLNWRERAVAAWFGPKGFASVTFGLMIYNARVPDADHLYHLVALAIVVSIFAHSSTDVLLARWLQHASRRNEAG